VERSTLMDKLAELEAGLQEQHGRAGGAEEQLAEARQQVQGLEEQQAAALKQVGRQRGHSCWHKQKQRWCWCGGAWAWRHVWLCLLHALMALCLLWHMAGHEQCCPLLQVEELSVERERLCSTVQAQAAQVEALQAQVAGLQLQREQALESSRRAGSDLDAALDSSHKMIKQVRSFVHSAQLRAQLLHYHCLHQWHGPPWLPCVSTFAAAGCARMQPLQP
jgi:hypothetical protein